MKNNMKATDQKNQGRSIEKKILDILEKMKSESNKELVYKYAEYLYLKEE